MSQEAAISLPELRPDAPPCPRPSHPIPAFGKESSMSPPCWLPPLQGAHCCSVISQEMWPGPQPGDFSDSGQLLSLLWLWALYPQDYLEGNVEVQHTLSPGVQWVGNLAWPLGLSQHLDVLHTGGLQIMFLEILICHHGSPWANQSRLQKWTLFSQSCRAGQSHPSVGVP